jgi:hypothetical protein
VTQTPTPSLAPAPSDTATATSTPTELPSQTATSTVPPTATNTPTASATESPTPTETETPTPPVCEGACSGTGVVTVDDILKLINISLEMAPPEICPDGIPDGGPVVEEDLIVAVDNLLVGCPDE